MTDDTSPAGEAPKKVLLVEDNDMVRAVTRRILERGKMFVVATAVNAADALRQCEKSGFDVDLVITDIEMPGMSGIELAEKIRLVRPGLRMLLISGHPEEQLLTNGLIPGGAAFLGKPFTPDELLAKAQEVLSAG